jgi:hypothetical protein
MELVNWLQVKNKKLSVVGFYGFETWFLLDGQNINCAGKYLDIREMN